MSVSPPSARRDELLDATYRYVTEHGLGELSLRPLAKAIGSSPRVLLYLFGSKAGLLRALFQRARDDELAMLARLDVPAGGAPTRSVEDVARDVWGWLAAAEHRAVLTLWVEAYAHSLARPGGPWGDFARSTVVDWLDLLARSQPPHERRTAAGRDRRTAALAVLRGGLLDLLATGDEHRTTAAVRRALGALEARAT